MLYFQAITREVQSITLHILGGANRNEKEEPQKMSPGINQTGIQCQ